MVRGNKLRSIQYLGVALKNFVVFLVLGKFDGEGVLPPLMDHPMVLLDARVSDASSFTLCDLALYMQIQARSLTLQKET